MSVSELEKEASSETDASCCFIFSGSIENRDRSVRYRQGTVEGTSVPLRTPRARVCMRTVYR